MWNVESLKVILLEEFHSFKSGISQHDDVTFMIIDYSGNEPVSEGISLDSKVESSIRGGKPVQITTYKYGKRMRDYIDTLLGPFSYRGGP